MGSTQHATPAVGLEDPARTATVQAIRHNIADTIEAAMIELNEWCESSVEHPNDILFEDARDKFAWLVTLVNALHTLGPPLSHDELDELRATNWSLSVGIED